MGQDVQVWFQWGFWFYVDFGFGFCGLDIVGYVDWVVGGFCVEGDVVGVCFGIWWSLLVWVVDYQMVIYWDVGDCQQVFYYWQVDGQVWYEVIVYYVYM